MDCRAIAFLTAYGIAILAFLPRLSLWLDEILTLVASGKPDTAQLIEHLRTTAGGTPLAFLVPHWSMQLLGDGAFAGRLPSALASIAACIGIYVLARRYGFRWPLAVLVLFALCPLQFRYAMEARPYALAFCLTVWATVAITRPLTRWTAVAYAALVISSGLTLAYALFVPLAHFIALRAERRKLLLIAASGLATLSALVPWYLYFREDWVRELAHERVAPWDWRTPLVFLREITGAGYIGTALAAIGVVQGMRRTGASLLWWWLLVPIVLIPPANIAFHYFFAVRQMIYVLAPLALLFVFGIEHWGRRGCLLLAALLAAFVFEDVKWVTKPREDWAAAAERAATVQASCIAFVPLDAEIFYGYMRPELVSRQCPLGPPADRGPVVLAISPAQYDPDNAYTAVREALIAQGYAQQSSDDFTGPRVELWRAR